MRPHEMIQRGDEGAEQSNRNRSVRESPHKRPTAIIANWTGLTRGRSAKIHVPGLAWIRVLLPSGVAPRLILLSRLCHDDGRG